jgi:hypothetical protein
MEIFAKLGGQIKPAEAMAFLKTVDKDKSGSIDFNVSYHLILQGYNSNRGPQTF